MFCFHVCFVFMLPVGIVVAVLFCNKMEVRAIKQPFKFLISNLFLLLKAYY